MITATFRTFSAPALILAFFATGCGSDVPGRAAGVAGTRDSAGVMIVENGTQGTWEAGDGWSVMEAVTIGQLTGPPEYTFSRILEVAVSGGRVYVLNFGNRTIKVYDTAGTHLFNFGGEGEGPAEFQRPFAMDVARDTVVVFDYELQKLAYFNRDGELVRTERAGFSLVEYGFPGQMAILPEGFAFVFGSGCSIPMPEDPRPKWKLMTVGRGGGIRDTVAMVVNQNIVAVYGQGESMFCEPTLSLGRPQPLLAVGPDGVAAFGTGSSYEIRVFKFSHSAEYAAGTSIHPLSAAASLLPRPRRIIRRDAPSLQLPEDEIEEYRHLILYRRRRAGGNINEPVDPDRVAAFEAAWDSIGIPETRPAFDKLLWDANGNLWVRRSAPEAATVREWDVFNGDGVYLGAIELPAGLTVHAITSEMVWGTIRDELDVQYVKGYRIVR